MMNHALMVIDLVEHEPGFSFNYKDLHIPRVELWEGSSRQLMLTGVSFPYSFSIIPHFVPGHSRSGLDAIA